MKLYHGSPSQNITEFHLDTPRNQSIEGSGLYLTESYRIARGYAGSEGSVYVCQFKRENIFDATSDEQFKTLFSKVGKSHGINLLEIPYMDTTINGFSSGRYQITDQDGLGLFWQVKNLLTNEESFYENENTEDILEKISEEITEYMNDHFMIKFSDPSLGIIYVCTDLSAVEIVQEIIVGSKEDEDLL